MAPGIVPSMMRQKRQSSMSPPEHERARNLLQVAPHVEDAPAVAGGERRDGGVLPESEFNNEPAAGRKARAGRRKQPPDRRQAVFAGEQRRVRLVVADFRRQRRQLALG